MCSLFGLIDYKGVLSCRTKNHILNTLARICEARGTPGSLPRRQHLPALCRTGQSSHHVFLLCNLVHPAICC